MAIYDGFIPKKIVNYPEATPGHVVTAEEWTRLWRLNIEQGDHAQQSLIELIDFFNLGILAPGDGSKNIDATLAQDNEGNFYDTKNVQEWLQTFYDKDKSLDADILNLFSADTNINLRIDGILQAGQTQQVKNAKLLDGQPLNYFATSAALTTTNNNLAITNTNLASAVTDANTRMDGLNLATNTRINNIMLSGSQNVVNNANMLNGQLGSYYAKATDISTLNTRIDNLVIGEISGLAHSALTERDAADAHPMSAITGLQDALSSQMQTVMTSLSETDSTAVAAKNNAEANTLRLNNLTHNTLPGVTATGAHAVEAITYNPSTTLKNKLDSIDLIIANITGSVSEITHNDLLGRDVSNAHPMAAITGLTTALAQKAATAHTHAIANVTGLQTALDGKALSSHTHTIANVTNLQTTLDGKAAASHTHTIANVTNLQTTLDGKAASAHTHTIANVTGLQAAIDGKSATTHTHTLSALGAQKAITISTAQPSGGTNGDIWIVYA